ncbi:MAG: hypothetical protein WBE82_16250 [Xanthobacteraceae bacterium]
MKQHGVAIDADLRRRGIGDPDTLGDKSGPRWIVLAVGRQPIGDGERFSLGIVDGDDAAHRLHVVLHDR